MTNSDDSGIRSPTDSHGLNQEFIPEEEEEQQKHKPKTLEAVETFVSTTTFHGFDQIFSSGSMYIKVFWSLTMVGVFIVVSFQLKSLISYFMDNPTLTSINVVYPEDGLKLPTLTICTLSKLNHTAIKIQYPNVNKTLAEFSTASFLSAYSTSLMDLGYFSRQGMPNAHLQKDLEKALGDRNITQYFEDATFHCEAQFLVCWFENGEVTDCCQDGKITVKRYLVHSGPCYEFEANKSLDVRQRLPGPVGGFGFVYWYPNRHILNSAFNSYDEHAVHLFMSPADAMLEKNPIALPVGYHTHISLAATRTRKQMYDELGRKVCKEPQLKYFDDYSYANCQVECLIDAMLTQCNCTGLGTYGKIPQDRLCNPVQAMSCYQKLAYEFTGMLVKCRSQKCEEACDYWTYRPSLTVGKVFNPIIEEQMLKYWRLPDGDPSLSLIIGDVYFDEIQYTDVEQKSAVTAETFVSTIGGAMGLWTGASIITWIHLVYFCLYSLCAKHKARQEARKKSELLQENKKLIINMAAKNRMLNNNTMVD